jgi:hypothetical protein
MLTIRTGTKSSPNDVLPLVIPGYSSPQKSLDGPANTTIPPPPKLPPNMFTDSLLRILEIKSGPFWEHSPQLYSIATGVPRWEKVRSGLCKMYEVRFRWGGRDVVADSGFRQKS